MAKSVMVFQNEVSQIESEEIRKFTMLCLEDSPEEFQNDEELSIKIKKKIKVMLGLMDQEGGAGAFKDLIISAILLSDITINDFKDEHKQFHPLTVRSRVNKFAKEVNPQIYEPILTIIEEHEGEGAAHKKLRPQAGSPAYVLALVEQVLKLDFINVVL